MDLSIAHDRDQLGRDRLTLEGAIDLASRGEFLDAGRGLVRAGATVVTIDLAGVTFVDSSGIGALVELTHDAEDHGATIVLVAPSDRVRRLLEITGLADNWAMEKPTNP